MRELTLTDVHHPEHIGDDWTLVTHPTVAPIINGAPTLGWEGDSRLAVYLHKPTQTFVLWRLEQNMEYMPVGQFAMGESITPASVNRTIQRLVEVDSRRGYDPGQQVMLEVARGDNLREQARQARVAEAADRLLFGMSQSHMPGIDVKYPRNLLRSR